MEDEMKERETDEPPYEVTEQLAVDESLVMSWNCVVCDAAGEVPYGLGTTMETLLSDILMQHEVITPECPVIRTGNPQISIWEPVGSYIHTL